MKKSFIFAVVLAAGVMAFVACSKKDHNDPETQNNQFNIEDYVGQWHLDSMVADGVTTIRPIDVEIINDSLLQVSADYMKEPQAYRWSHADGKINGPWIWSSPVMYVDYSVVTQNSNNAVLRKEDNGMLLYFTHIIHISDIAY